jgi:superfamily II DNA or RNA helicase
MEPPELIPREAATRQHTLELVITLDIPAGCLTFEWRRAGDPAVVARGRLRPADDILEGFWEIGWELEGESRRDCCSSWPASVRALLGRIRKRFPVEEQHVRLQVRAALALGPIPAGGLVAFQPPARESVWKWLARQVQTLAQVALTFKEMAEKAPADRRATAAAHFLASEWLGVAPKPVSGRAEKQASSTGPRLRFIRNFARGCIELEWADGSRGKCVARGEIVCSGRNTLTWVLDSAGVHEQSSSGVDPGSIRRALEDWLGRFPAPPENITSASLRLSARASKPTFYEDPPFDSGESPQDWMVEDISQMARELGQEFERMEGWDGELGPLESGLLEREEKRQRRKEQKRVDEELRRQETMARLAAERREREQKAALERRIRAAEKAAEESRRRAPSSGAADTRLPVPPVPVTLELPRLELQETTLPMPDLRGYSLREQGTLWWVSNQSDDLLCLPYCRIERLEYQIRTALRALGPLRGRALLSDEVGLGKTIEAGLVLKELLTRGMVKRFLVLTVPSLVDQWEEELAEKFGLATQTTNRAIARNDSESFWRDNPGIVASLHTLKQAAHLEVARQVPWDLLIVDEAHYLRRRESQAWQAVNELPRRFLLLLTATPVQNSLEELYNLITLLQPGQLPSPKEFRARFLDPKRPRQPREPEELRRMVGQVMIRNTRANAGLQLPSRRAETVLFEPTTSEKEFWQEWDIQLRRELAELNASQASLWGRLLLQAAGSSPAAWRNALESFPRKPAARAWQREVPLTGSWERKCEMLLPLTRGEGGLVIFTQFLQTQAALVEYLRSRKVETFFINGSTPAPERQPITEEFRRHGGALILTHSGTEGRNLQFSHRLANFDLPWNPMEIEQRIGRLHRLGQQHPVRIFNFVQAGTLQEHLLQILQEKLNLFELVVGETGLILGERFSSDEFAEEVLKRWRENEGRVGEAMAGLGEELATARDEYSEVKQLDETLFAKDYESL